MCFLRKIYNLYNIKIRKYNKTNIIDTNNLIRERGPLSHTRSLAIVYDDTFTTADGLAFHFIRRV